MILQAEVMQHQNTWNRENVEMLGEKCNVMIGSKDCCKSNTSVNKIRIMMKMHCTDFF